MLRAGSPHQDEATRGHCGVEALTTLEVAARVLGGERGYGGPKLVQSVTLGLIYLTFTVSNILKFNLQHLKVSWFCVPIQWVACFKTWGNLVTVGLCSHTPAVCHS